LVTTNVVDPTPPALAESTHSLSVALTVTSGPAALPLSDVADSLVEQPTRANVASPAMRLAVRIRGGVMMRTFRG
jgi:hypothetical protein